MAIVNQTVEFLISALPNSFPKATINGFNGSNNFGRVFFSSGGGNVQIHSVRAWFNHFAFETIAGSGAELSRQKNVLFDCKFSFAGFWLNSDGTVIRNSQPKILDSPNNCFAPSIIQNLMLTSYSPEISPKCFFAGGLVVDRLFVYLGAMMDSPNPSGSFGSLIVNFEIEV